MASSSNISALLFFMENSGDIEDVNREYSEDEARKEQELVDLYLQKGKVFNNCVDWMGKNLSSEMSDEEIQTKLYDCGKLFYGKERLREFFSDIYFKITEKYNSGARLGILIGIIGVEKFIETMRSEVILFDTEASYS